jgi:uncharacterized membrane protein
MPFLLSHVATSYPTVLAAFLASAVEFVEALTIVLAVLVVSGWRNAVAGSVAGVLVLAAVVAAAGPLLARINIGPVQVVAGAALLIFGLRWLRKGILRAAGRIALNDEEKAFTKEVGELKGHRAKVMAGLDIAAAGTAFNGVLVEGFEVVFIVVAMGVSAGKLVAASLGAAIALAVVALAGIVLRRPITAIPANTLKLAVAFVLCGLGVFWVGEGLGVHWPGGDWAGLEMAAGFAVFAGILVQVLKRLPAATRAS